MDVIRAIRNLRAEMNVSVGRRAHLIVRPKAGWEHAMAGAGEYFGRLAWASGMQLLAQDEEAPAKTVSAVSEGVHAVHPAGRFCGLRKEIARLTKELDSVQRTSSAARAKLNNPGLSGKAPAAARRAGEGQAGAESAEGGAGRKAHCGTQRINVIGDFFLGTAWGQSLSLGLRRGLRICGRDQRAFRSPFWTASGAHSC